MGEIGGVTSSTIIIIFYDAHMIDIWFIVLAC
jgi:hypothetical protein